MALCHVNVEPSKENRHHLDNYDQSDAQEIRHLMTGRIFKVYPGSDDEAYVANVKLPNEKIVKRNIHNLCDLLLED